MKKLYKIDENDNVREWWMEIDKDRYRAHSGVVDGKTVISGWKTAKGKNIGKINETSAEEQAQLIVDRTYRNQLETGGYYETVEAAHERKTVYFEVMLASKWEDLKKKPAFPWFSQPKLDGVRCTNDAGSLKSRNGKPFISVPHISDAMSSLNELGIVFDGELYNHDLKEDFEKIISLVRKTKPTEDDIAEAAQKVEYHVYDMFDKNNPSMPFSERHTRLKAIIEGLNNPHIILVPTYVINDLQYLDQLNGAFIEDGYEGQMIRFDAPYEYGRGRNLIKRKEFDEAEFVIDYLEEGVGNWAGAVKRAYIRLEDGSIQRSGVRGTYDMLANFLARADEFPGTEVTVRFAPGRTNDGKLRFPVVKHFWQGKRSEKE